MGPHICLTPVYTVRLEEEGSASGPMGPFKVPISGAEADGAPADEYSGDSGGEDGGKGKRLRMGENRCPFTSMNASHAVPYLSFWLLFEIMKRSHAEAAEALRWKR
jgi:hypothetical protein